RLDHADDLGLPADQGRPRQRAERGDDRERRPEEDARRSGRPDPVTARRQRPVAVERQRSSVTWDSSPPLDPPSGPPGPGGGSILGQGDDEQPRTRTRRDAL